MKPHDGCFGNAVDALWYMERWIGSELAQVRLPRDRRSPQLVILEVNRDEIVFAASDFQDPEQAEVTDEGITVTKRQALNVQGLWQLGLSDSDFYVGRGIRWFAGGRWSAAYQPTAVAG